jgi:hypothetical protein
MRWDLSIRIMLHLILHVEYISQYPELNICFRFTWPRSWGKLDPQATPMRFAQSRLRQIGSTSRTLEIHMMIKVETSWIHKSHPWDSYDDQGWGKLDPQARTHEIRLIKVEANWIHKPHPWNSLDQRWGKLDSQATPMRFAQSRLRQIGSTSHTHKIKSWTLFQQSTWSLHYQ